MSRISSVLPALAFALILPLSLFTMPASGQQTATRQLPHATCLAMAAAGIARGEAELWVRPPKGKPLPPQGGLSRSAAILDGIFDGRAPSSVGRKPCVPKTLTPKEVGRLRAVIPKLAKAVDRNIKKWRAKLAKADKILANDKKRGEAIAAARRKVAEIEDKARAAVAAKPRHANQPKVRARLDRIKREAEYWNKKAIEHPREVKKAREDKEQATGFIGQLGQVRGELGEMKSALK